MLIHSRTTKTIFTLLVIKLTLAVFNYTMLIRKEEVIVMKTQSRLMDVVKTNYMVIVIALLGIFAFLSAILVAWPAVAYLAAKLFG